MPFIVAPAADFDGSGQLTTLARALYRPTGALTGLTNGVSYRAMALSAASASFAPQAEVVPTPPSLTVPIEDIVLTIGDPDLVIDLDDHFSGALGYSVSPAVAGVSRVGSMLTIDTAAVIATVELTVTASNNDGSTEDTVFVTVSATAPEVLEDLELQRGQPAAFSVMIDGAGPVSATHLPIGMVLNPTTGAVTGTPLSVEPETTVTVTRGAATASFKFSVLPKIGIGIIPPRFRSHNIDTNSVEALGLWNGQSLTATSRATLITSIATAAADTGTVGAPKIHRINYTGAPIDADATIGPAGEVWSDRIHTIIVLANVDARARLTFRGRPGVLICIRNSLLAYGVTCGEGGSVDVFGCRIGTWHLEGSASFQTGGAPVQAYGGSIFVAACRIAGAMDVVAARSCRVTLIENMITHFTNDLLNGGMNTTGGDVLVWRCADVADRSAENTGTNNHGDALQFHTPGTAVNISYTDQLTVVNMAQGLYPSSGARQNGQNYPSMHNQLDSVVYAITGWDVAVVFSADTQINGLLGLPAFGMGASGARLFFDDVTANDPPPGTLSLANIVTTDVVWGGGWAAHAIGIEGANIRYSLREDMSITFPDVEGEVILDRYGNGLNRFIMPRGQVAFHPASIRRMFEPCRPAAGWASIGQLPMEDRMIWADHWGAEPTLTVPAAAIAGAELTATALALDVTSSAAAGIVYWMITPTAGTPNETMVLQGIDPVGVRFSAATQPAPSWTGVLDNKVVASGHYRYSGGVIPQITASAAFDAGVDYHLHIVIETPEGAISPVTSQVLTHGAVAPVPARFSVANNAGPFFANPSGETLGVNTGQITFAMRASFDADQGAQKFLLALGGTGLMLRLNANRSLRLTVNDGAGNAVLAQTDTATALFAFDTDVDIVLSVDLVAGYARIWVNGTQVLNASLTAGSGTFSETATIYLLSQLVGGAGIPGANIERMRLWKTAAPAGALPGAAPVVDITGPASAANAHAWKRGADAV